MSKKKKPDPQIFVAWYVDVENKPQFVSGKFPDTKCDSYQFTTPKISTYGIAHDFSPLALTPAQLTTFSLDCVDQNTDAYWVDLKTFNRMLTSR